ncbi:MAG TPA: radical SAM protein [Thermoguttaceae bacterium]|nr:radical SAM protein [Thermoguttaceae bacterium]
MSDPTAKILLVYPPSRTQSHHSCPMALTMLAAVLEEAGHQVHLLDANAAARRRSTAQIVDEATRIRPDVIGVTLLTPLVKEAYRLASSLKACGAKLIAGGPHATLLPDEPLAHGFDAVVVGEGEPTIVEAVRAVRGLAPMSSVRGLVFRTPDGGIEHNEPRPPIADLDTLPSPARHLVDPADFGSTVEGSLHTSIFTSRGCPGRCSYCAGGLFGKKFRFRSADNVVDELVAVHRDYGTRHFYFADDAMSMDKERMRRICERLIDERLGLTWSMMTRIDAVDEDLLQRATRAGCVQIDYGVESGNPDTLKRIHKPHTADMVRRVIPLTHKFGIRPAVFFILGFPWEDAPAIDATLTLMKEISPCVVFHPAIASILIPFPGTEIYDRYKDRYGFARWWVSDDRTFDTPRIGTHPFYQWVSYRVGAVLDADFFHYTPETKAKIHEVFRFMLASNLRQRSRLARAIKLSAFDLSRKLDAVSPLLERAVFTGPVKVWELMKHARGVST